MSKPLSFAALAAALSVSACAQKADNIEPSAVSSSKYRAWSCQQLLTEQAFTESALGRVSANQDRAASNDALMVFLIGIPTSGGGTPGEVARLKGEREAIRRSLVRKNCVSARGVSGGKGYLESTGRL